MVPARSTATMSVSAVAEADIETWSKRIADATTIEELEIVEKEARDLQFPPMSGMRLHKEYGEKHHLLKFGKPFNANKTDNGEATSR